MKSETLTALVIDDHPITHLGARSLLMECGFEIIHKSENGSDALRYLERTIPDLIVLDLGLPGVGGLALLPQIQSRSPKTPVLVFTMNENPAFARMAMNEGANAFLSKNAPPDHFITAVQNVMEGGSYLEPKLALNLATRSRTAPDMIDQLTPREIQVLRMISQGHSYEDIALQINVSYKTVANVSAALRRKLSARNLPELILIGAEMDAPNQN